MSSQHTPQDPLEFVRSMWGNMGFSLPGMVTPTLDVDELDKRISDLKTVENWLKMNLNMLQMTTQGLEMQRAALSAMQAMGEHARTPHTAAPSGPSSTHTADPAGAFASATALWPWNLMSGLGAATGAAEADPSASAPMQNGMNTPPKPREPRKASSSGQKKE